MIIHVAGKRYYDVPEGAYGYCGRCKAVYDAWRYADPGVCPQCGLALLPVGPGPGFNRRHDTGALQLCLEQCEEDGCFGEGFAYPVPLRPTLLIKHKDGFTDEYGGERRIQSA